MGFVLMEMPPEDGWLILAIFIVGAPAPDGVTDAESPVGLLGVKIFTELESD